MNIDREKALNAFEAYVEHYNRKEEKVRLKIEHTYRVSGLCEKIAGSLGLSEEDVDLAWLLGILHDVGRFEQLRQYGTFIDAQSINHALFGTEILFKQRKIRDADKVDILKVHVDFPLEEIYNVSTKELRSYAVTKEVMEAFFEEHAVLRSLKKTPVDYVVGHIALIYEMVYPESVKITVEQGYLNKLMDFRSENKETMAQFEVIKRKMQLYLAGKF